MKKGERFLPLLFYSLSHLRSQSQQNIHLSYVGTSQPGPKPVDNPFTNILSPPVTERSNSPVEVRAVPLRTTSGRSSGFSSVQNSPIKPNSLPARGSDFRSLLERGETSFIPGQDELPDTLDTGVSSNAEHKFSSSLPNFDTAETSPWLSDLFLPSSDLPPNFDQVALGFPTQPGSPKSDGLGFSALLQGDVDDVEEIVRRSDPYQSSWPVSVPGWDPSAQWNDQNATPSIIKDPDLGMASPEMLVMRFDKITCGILSVKDGASENPWRTLVWPMAKDTPALYHALFSLAAFHSTKENPAFRVPGVDHMRRSIACMVQGIQNMRTDAALATSLALAFADTWDQHTRTCIQHLRGAKALVSQVLRDGMQASMYGGNMDRVRFLYNTWLYMDVIARLTSLEECGSQVLDFPILEVPNDTIHEIDPLMGCAATLFPLIDRAVRLIQSVRRRESNSVALVSQAIELKTLIERWEPPEFFEPPEDPTSDVQHSIQTAHAYRWATLLYLHQAVPEMPSESASELAKRVLILLATVPIGSRATIVHMFPLLAAGCEADQEEDRNWVMERWTAIQSRLMLGGVDRCLEVVREVWARRDAFEAEKLRRQMRTGRGGQFVTTDKLARRGLIHGGVGPEPLISGGGYAPESWRKRSVTEDSKTGTVSRRNSMAPRLENIEYEKTVRGRLHWVNVMKEWKWEGKLI